MINLIYRLMDSCKNSFEYAIVTAAIAYGIVAIGIVIIGLILKLIGY